MDHLIAEALRYLGVREPDEDTLKLVQDAARAVSAGAGPRYVTRIGAVDITGEGAVFPDTGLTLPGRMAAGMLAECEKAALLCCTLGPAFERMLLSARARDMAWAVALDACGSARVEEGCDEAEKALAARYPGFFLTDRFSPGYGDLPLDVQPRLLDVLDAQRRLGVYTLPSRLMVPVKTVTAVIGLSRRPQPARVRGCAHCNLSRDCAYRERGMTCELA